MGKISATQVPNLDPSLVHTYRTSGGGGRRFMHPSDSLAGGEKPSSQAFRASRMLVEMPCFVLRSDTVEERHRSNVCYCVSDLAPSKMDFQASPRGGAEADFEAQKAYYRLLCQ